MILLSDNARRYTYALLQPIPICSVRQHVQNALLPEITEKNKKIEIKRALETHSEYTIYYYRRSNAGRFNDAIDD